MEGSLRVMDEEWDHLIVLDGCRYDYFSRLHGVHMDGKLERALSVGSNTEEWRDNSFPEEYEDVVYVSANPYINSRIEVGGFSGSEHFLDVMDVWDWGWDLTLGTVHPDAVNHAAREALMQYPGERLIIHYLQPHCPYIGMQPQDTGFPVPVPGARTVLDGTRAQGDDSPGEGGRHNHCPDQKLSPQESGRGERGPPLAAQRAHGAAPGDADGLSEAVDGS